MATATRQRRERYIDGMEILHPGLEGSLLIGTGFKVWPTSCGRSPIGKRLGIGGVT